MRRLLAAPLVAALGLAFGLFMALDADAAGLGFSLPKFRSLVIADPAGPVANTAGVSAQVVGTTLTVSGVHLGVGLDLAATRDFARGLNYAFFDLGLEGGVPLGITPAFYVSPGLGAHGLFFVASPEGLGSPVLSLGPRLAFGYTPSANVSVELGGTLGFLLGAQAGGAPRGGTSSIVELGGTYTF
jgi:hypothetical protein